jgi:iron complex outermembrane receptor protein
MLDGLPLNDPTGFAPDMYDVDWATVDRVEVMRGPVGFLYGGGSSGGIINIETRRGKDTPTAGGVWAAAGSNGFWKTLGEFGGNKGDWNYRVSASRNMGDGYRVHTAFDSTNLYGKFNWKAADKLLLSIITAGTGFFNQNAEGLNLQQVEEDRTQANPDATKYNEYQRTNRFTTGVHGNWILSQSQNLSFTGYARETRYTESVPSSVIHRSYKTPGGSVQYQFQKNGGNWLNNITGGMDLDGQLIDDYKHPNLGNAVEGPEYLSDGNIDQSRLGLFLMDRLELGSRWALLFGIRNDRIHQNLTDHLKLNGEDLSGEATFTRTTGRVGVTYNPKQNVGLYASWGQGFMPPATEELYANPAALGGFNTSLIPQTSHGEEVGVRGNFRDKVFYDAAFFHLITDNDFERYRIPSRPLETFYRNAGDSRRYGLETEVDWYPIKEVALRGAYTYADYIYTVYTSVSYPGNWAGNSLPNSPRHQFAFDAEFKPTSKLVVGTTVQALSSAYIDVTNNTWIDSYGLLNMRIAYQVNLWGATGQILVTGKNLTNTLYIAFTEPDPDGNSYQPGPEREFFGGLQFWF